MLYHAKPINKTYQPFVSVIIPVRNEAANIVRCLHSIESQDYPVPNYEIILVDDNSEDNTVVLAKSLDIPNLRILHSTGNTKYAYKKVAITYAISQAKGEIILTTDGDCVVPRQWISGMVSQFDELTGMVAGPVRLTGNSWFQQFQRLEFCGLQLVGAGSIARNSPTMANGANLAYRKSSFDAVNGFQHIDSIASGDDELLMHKMFAVGLRVRFAKLKDVIVNTEACRTWEEFRNQRIRWVSKSTVYQNRRITLTLANAYLANLSLFILLFWS
ncbi:MAG: glycosyltransferase, partial [Bacteroidia bacterium]|nr:glycosyltransferase [Bacteroidia bacterium]